MHAAAFATEIEIAAPPDAVWRALTRPAGPRSWMNDAEVVSDWSPGADIAIDVLLEGRVRRDRGTVVAAERPTLLGYSLWSSISRWADGPEHRSVVTFRLVATDSGGTRLSVQHEGPGAATAVPHAAFFWPVALAVLRDEIEGQPTGALTLRDVGA